MVKPDVVIRKSKIGQFEKGVFANRNFRKGEILIRYNLKELSDSEFRKLPKSEKRFVHSHWGKLFLYPFPARFVNHSSNPNTIQNMKRGCDIAARRIRKGEEITTDAARDDI